ncbi:MAG TPA: type II toxin-antitoxin system VapC family toxin [Longimicrobiaceae bacterium]|nr:type II toxin-antitoxin system VapC family toxin [Longimicrobiaceae bacterium]
MKLLLDTHALLWFLGGNERLSAQARSAIEDLSNQRLFSMAGAWEVAIKVSLGKLSLHAPFEQLVPGELRANAIELLPILPQHVIALASLPFHHRDPFDRMLVAQATVEGASVVSADPTLDAYEIPRIW